MFIGRAAMATSPALIRSSQGSPVIGTRRATGWPRSVISIDSPAATSSRYLLACCRSSRTPIVFMCYKVAHEDLVTGRRGSPSTSTPDNPSKTVVGVDRNRPGNREQVNGIHRRFAKLLQCGTGGAGNHIYVVDSGNNRVLKLEKSFAGQ